MQQINLKKGSETHQKLWNLIDNFWNNVTRDQSLQLLIIKSDWSVFDVKFVDWLWDYSREPRYGFLLPIQGLRETYCLCNTIMYTDPNFHNMFKIKRAHLM